MPCHIEASDVRAARLDEERQRRRTEPSPVRALRLERRRERRANQASEVTATRLDEERQRGRERRANEASDIHIGAGLQQRGGGGDIASVARPEQLLATACVARPAATASSARPGLLCDPASCATRSPGPGLLPGRVRCATGPVAARAQRLLRHLAAASAVRSSLATAAAVRQNILNIRNTYANILAMHTVVCSSCFSHCPCHRM